MNSIYEVLEPIYYANVIVDEVLMKAREITSLQRPSDRDYRSVKRWVHGTKPIVADEEEFIHCKEDLVTLRHGRECAGFDGFMETLLQKTNCRLIRVSCTELCYRKAA